jgi:hypothetical protein
MAASVLSMGADYNLLISAGAQVGGGSRRGQSGPAPRNKGMVMNLPIIEIASLPDLDVLTGIFGSLADPGNLHVDDAFIDVMVYVYEIIKSMGGG